MADDIERLDRIIRETLPELEADGLNYGPFHYRYASRRAVKATRIASRSPSARAASRSTCSR